MDIWSTKDFTLRLSDVEIICEGGGFMWLRENHNFTLSGPFSVDVDPLEISQCEIVGTDGKTYLEVQTMPGYSEPENRKVIVYDAQGRTLPTKQTWPTGFESLGGGRYRLEFDGEFMAIPGLAKAGNFLIVLQGSSASIDLSCSCGVTIEHMTAYCGGGFRGLHYGDLSIRNCRAMRRPGTNRLFGGNQGCQIWTDGMAERGNFSMDRCEMAWNDDDLSDIFSWLALTAANAGSGYSLYASGSSWSPGKELRIFDLRSLELVGTASIKSVEPIEDQTALQTLCDALKTVGMRETCMEQMRLVQLDQTIQIPGLCLIDCKQAGWKRMTVTNSYLHDGLNTGICLKGGEEVLIANNYVERTALAGIAACMDSWWLEGGIPGMCKR